ncbi:RsmE family RNA methyltransferase [Rickettsia endosymbiont of Cardiosporidium cionae]|uniref:RsmE family RNA methyltransferase n=1 Tax=Rickettsia endosymbiont of Cardiosporidium cionae TaxID=2777155 RepID=UPI001893022A|nr:RsmE family RNA methyltransferase [Rickettsia endosymbiont of Cardiosporidium cionae]KAF8818414.1 16S rRNA (uracil(1498)-N(3))-methyltransferase [Rickettsia endosymbiont of Cardiosporidium cionae]
MTRDDSFFKMTRKYLFCNISINDVVTFDEEQSHHIIHVLRLKQDSLLRVFNEKDGEFLSKIILVKGSICKIIILSFIRCKPETKKRLNLAIGLIKTDKMKEVVKNATALGVVNIIFLLTERSQYSSVNLSKMSKIATGAAEQSEGFIVPSITNASLEEFLINYSNYHIIFLNESEDSNRLANITMLDHDVALLVGPEGGFSSDERSRILARDNIISVSLGLNILRTELAVTVAISYLRLSNILFKYDC